MCFSPREDDAIKNNNGAADSKELKRNPEREEGRTKKQRDEKRYNIWKRSETVGKTLGSPRTITTSAGYATHGSSFLSHGSPPPWLSILSPLPIAIPKRGFILGSFASKWNFRNDGNSGNILLSSYSHDRDLQICIEDRNPFISIPSPRFKNRSFHFLRINLDPNERVLRLNCKKIQFNRAIFLEKRTKRGKIQEKSL